MSIDDALSRIDQAGQSIEDRFSEAATSFKVALAEALDVLKTVEVNADASAVTTDITVAVQAADTTPTITADASEVTTGIDQAVNAADATPVINADTTAIAPEIDQAVASADTTVLLQADTSEVDAALANTADQASNLGGASREAGAGLGSIAPAAALATGELGKTQDLLGEITPGMAGAAGATAGLALAGKDLFTAALEQNTALARLREQFGPLASEIEHVHVGGLNEDLAHLAERAGADVDGLRNFAASFAQLGHSAGDSTPHIAEVATQINALAVRASVLNPNLGTADEIVQRLSTSLARGGRFLAAYGIALNTADINAEALRETGKRTASELTIYEKEVAGATLATQQLGTSLGSDINEGSQKAVVQLRRLKIAFEETLKSAGAPLIQPTIDTFKELEPVLAEAASLLGITLADALHIVGPPLRALAETAQAIPTPVLAAFAAFLLFQRVGPLVADAGRAVASFAVGMVRDMSIADVAATAGVGGIIAVFALLITQWKEQEAAAKAWAEQTAQSVGGVTTESLPALEAKIDSLRAKGSSFFAAINFNPFSQDAATKAQDQADALQKIIDKAQEAAHITLTQAVATDTLSRAQEVNAINTTPLVNGHVNWLGVLKTLQPELAGAARQTQLYGDAQTRAAEVTDPVVAAQDRYNQAIAQAGDALERQLVASGQFTQSQVDIANAINANKDGSTDYAKALDALSPGLGAVSTASGQLAGGLDTTATKFQFAADEAKIFQTAVDELLSPLLNAEQAEVGWHQAIDTLTAGLVANGATIDLNTKAGRDNEANLIALARAGADWVDKLIAEGASADQVNKTRTDEITLLQGLQKQYPPLAGLIQGYIDHLNAIPATRDTTVTANTAQAQAAFNELTNSINNGTFAAQTLQQQINLVNRAFANSPFATNFASQPGEPGFQRQAGGPVWPGVWTVGEAGPETLFINQSGSGFVVPNPGTPSTAPSAGPQIDYDRLGRSVANALQGQRPIQVFEAVHPDATAAAIDARLGARVNF